MATPNQNMVTEQEQEQKDTARYKEINAKPEAERSADEKKELGELKQRHGERMQKKIDTMTYRTKTAEEKAEEATRRAEEAERKAKELEERMSSADTTTIVGNENETVEIGGKKYYTDAALLAQMKAGKITEQAAINYQNQRNEEKIVVRVKSDFQKEQETEARKKSQERDAAAVLSAHPEFGTKHPNHNPNDPLYMEWKELVGDGYGLTDGGLMKALKKAKKNLGIKNTHIDRSGDLGLEEVASPVDRGGGKKEKEVSFTPEEEQTAIDMYTRGDVINPATGRAYTATEAIAKAKAAKKARMK